jgi:death on curing protein
MISIKEAEQIHKILIDTFGGAHGIRDLSALESALSRPFQTFDDKELYPTAIDKAAALAESILNNHPFVDGNKRTGYVNAAFSIAKRSGHQRNSSRQI